MSAHTVSSPLPGIFYRAPAPGKPPFVAEGAPVEVGQTIGLVEIMKQFTEIKADAAGVLVSFEAADNGLVDSGDTLALIEPGSR